MHSTALLIEVSFNCERSNCMSARPVYTLPPLHERHVSAYTSIRSGIYSCIIRPSFAYRRIHVSIQPLYPFNPFCKTISFADTTPIQIRTSMLIIFFIDNHPPVFMGLFNYVYFPVIGFFCSIYIQQIHTISKF